MPNYDDFKKKAKGALETIADVSVEAYKLAEETAKVFARKTKLNAEIAREKATIRKLKFDLGGKYYDLHKDDAEDALKQCCEEITASLESIAAKRVELEDLKRSGSSGDQDAQAESEAEAEAEGEGENEAENADACGCGCNGDEVGDDEPEE